MDFLNESNGSNVSYLLDVSASLSLSDDDDQVNAIGLGVRDASNRDRGGERDEIIRAGGLGVHDTSNRARGLGVRDELSCAGGIATVEEGTTKRVAPLGRSIPVSLVPWQIPRSLASIPGLLAT